MKFLIFLNVVHRIEASTRMVNDCVEAGPSKAEIMNCHVAKMVERAILGACVGDHITEEGYMDGGWHSSSSGRKLQMCIASDETSGSTLFIHVW